MQNALTLFKRDLKAYFTSPIGYIYIVVFLLISVGLYMTTFFTFPVADMRNFFSNLPLLLCVFVPAVTMRVWAEERKENTWEMLLTFPMRASELVLGKYLATLAFFAIALAATCTVPIMLASLGNPDNGAVFGGYLGALLLGALFLSIGIFVSGFCKDQIVAFVVTLLACFAIYLVGTNFVAMQLDSYVSGLGRILADTVGVVGHYTPFIRGVVEIVDLVYFIAWTALFLILNMMYLQARTRPNAGLTYGGAVVLVLAIGLLFNWLIADQSFGRFDMTENKIYTVSPATEEILRELEAPIQATLYITPEDEMPADYAQLEQDIADKMEELRVASNGMIDFKTVNMRAANIAGPADVLGRQEEEEDEEAQAIEERMLDKGIEPFAVQAIEEDQMTTKLVYSSIGLGYGAEVDEIIPQVMPQTLPQLEYQIVNAVDKLTREEQPVLALVAPQDTIPPELRQLYAQMGQQAPQSVDPYRMAEAWLQQEEYDVRRVALTKDDPLPEDFDALVIINPRNFNDRQWWEVNRALASGKPVFLAVQQYEWDYRMTRQGMSINKMPIEPGVNDWLEAYGLQVSKNILMDRNQHQVSVNAGGGLGAVLGIGQPVTLPLHITLTGPSMNQDMPITSWLSNVYYLWGTALDIQDAKLDDLGLDLNILMTTGPTAWSVPAEASQQQLFESLSQEPESGQIYPVMAMAAGQFPDAFSDQPRPKWEKPQQPGMPPMPEEDEEEEPAQPIEPAESRLILLGAAEPFTDTYMRNPDNRDLLLNSVDALSRDEKLIQVRGKRMIARTIPEPDDGTKTFWKVINYGLINVAVIVIGIVVFAMRRRGRMAYTMSYARNAQ